MHRCAQARMLHSLPYATSVSALFIPNYGRDTYEDPLYNILVFMIMKIKTDYQIMIALLVNESVPPRAVIYAEVLPLQAVDHRLR